LNVWALRSTDEVIEKARAAKTASLGLGIAPSNARSEALRAMAEALDHNIDLIVKENEKDIAELEKKDPDSPLVDRLLLDRKRIQEITDSLRQVAELADPLGEIVEGWRTRQGLEIRKVRVPLGVIAVIYEARPNVTVDIIGLAIKSGNAVILRGGSEAINSNKALVRVVKESIGGLIPEGAIQLVENTDRALVDRLLELNECIDVVIPRGSAQLIRFVRENSRVPIIETGAGNVHIFVNNDADLDMATKIIINAKTQRPSVCNAVRKVLIHSGVAKIYLPQLVNSLRQHHVAVKGCERSRDIEHSLIEAKEEDWYEEYMDLTLAVKIVDSVQEAIEHINRYGTHHSDAIITSNINDANLFTLLVDSSTVYVNASTRFTDGNQFGFGAEVGISTQKLHARGPMGLKELTTTKYIVFGNGQVRE